MRARVAPELRVRLEQVDGISVPRQRHGRTDACDPTADDADVSPHHARLYLATDDE